MLPKPSTPAASKSTQKGKQKTIPWDQDGVDGGDSSMATILNWLRSDNNYQRWRDHCTGHAESLWSPCSEIYGLLDQNGIHHRDLKGITKQIYDLESSYHAARDWKRKRGADILARGLPNDAKKVEDYLRVICPYWDTLDPIMGSRSDAELLHIRESISAAHQRTSATNPPNPEGSNRPSGVDGSSRTSARATDNSHDESRTHTPASASASSNKKKKHHKKSELAGKKGTSTRHGKSKSKKNNIEDVFLKSILLKQQAKVIQAQAMAANTKVSYMKQLKEMGFDLAQITKMADKAFPAIPNLANDSESGSSNSSNDD